MTAEISITGQKQLTFGSVKNFFDTEKKTAVKKFDMGINGLLNKFEKDVCIISDYTSRTESLELSRTDTPEIFMVVDRVRSKKKGIVINHVLLDIHSPEDKTDYVFEYSSQTNSDEVLGTGTIKMPDGQIVIIADEQQDITDVQEYSVGPNEVDAIFTAAESTKPTLTSVGVVHNLFVHNEEYADALKAADPFAGYILGIMRDYKDQVRINPDDDSVGLFWNVDAPDGKFDISIVHTIDSNPLYNALSLLIQDTQSNINYFFRVAEGTLTGLKQEPFMDDKYDRINNTLKYIGPIQGTFVSRFVRDHLPRKVSK